MKVAAEHCHFIMIFYFIRFMCLPDEKPAWQNWGKLTSHWLIGPMPHELVLLVYNSISVAHSWSDWSHALSCIMLAWGCIAITQALPQANVTSPSWLLGAVVQQQRFKSGDVPGHPNRAHALHNSYGDNYVAGIWNTCILYWPHNLITSWQQLFEDSLKTPLSRWIGSKSAPFNCWHKNCRGIDGKTN